ncbi:MAG: calcineurin-like phosphoesterase family protein [Luteimonas sp.]|nr:calcineurin-like phosphoesterase family protein [Luteimonas sp.]
MTRCRPHGPILLFLLAALAIPAQACTSGRVFEDRNGDGLWQADEPGLQGVRVSDGAGIVSSGADGRFSGLRDGTSHEVFVIKPAGFRMRVDAGGLPAFWMPASARAGDGCTFGLQRDPAREGDLDVLVFSDPQVAGEAQVDYYARDIVATARAHGDAVLGLTLGDLVDDATALYPALNLATASLGLPWLHAPGNHDLDADARDDAGSLGAYRRVYGPDTYAWEEREAVFVLLDNVVAQPGARPAYVGGLRGEQFAFLQHYLGGLDRDRLLVVGTHIPWFDTAPEGRPSTVRTADRERLFALLRPFPKVLLLSGHRHTQRQFFHDAATGWQGASPLHEYNVGAASGAFWSGAKDAEGIPDATMADGTPNGFATLRVARDGRYRLAWHPARLRRDDPAFTAVMALHAPKVLRRGAYPAWGVYANVFMGHDGTRVEYRIAGGDWKPMAKVLAPDPRLLAENARDDLADHLRGRDRSPEAEPSTHLWRGVLDTKLSAGAHEVEVRVFDDAGDEHRAHIGYRLDEWRE